MTMPYDHDAIQVALQYHRAGRLQEAEVIYRQVLERSPDNCDALHFLGVIALQAGHHEDAIALVERAIRINPSAPAFHNNLGEAYRGLGLTNEALGCYERAIALRPDYREARINRANVLLEGGRLDEAIAVYRKEIELDPGFADAHWNLAFALLMRGDYAEGWKENEWRWQAKGFASTPRQFQSARHAPDGCASQALWNGEPPLGRTILLHAEQGFGDMIQFARYAPLAARLGARVIVECPPELKRLLASLEGVERVVATGEPLPPFHLHAPFMSLPLAFGTTLETVPAQVPYLKADPALADAWRRRLPSAWLAADVCRVPGTLKVGIAWSGSPQFERNRLRALSLEAFAPLVRPPTSHDRLDEALDVTDICFVSLQKGVAAEQALFPPAGMRLVNIADELVDFADTAALIANLDLVISTDTAVVHLAGALAKPVWTLLGSAPAWQWMLKRPDTPWYPSMRLFRQTEVGNWRTVLEQVAKELRRFPAKR